jgi:hypothetical protein
LVQQFKFGDEMTIEKTQTRFFQKLAKLKFFKKGFIRFLIGLTAIFITWILYTLLILLNAAAA